MKNKKSLLIVLGASVFSLCGALTTQSVKKFFTLSIDNVVDNISLLLDSSNKPLSFINGSASTNVGPNNAAEVIYSKAELSTSGLVKLLDGGTISKDKAANLATIKVAFTGSLKLYTGYEENKLFYEYDLTSNTPIDIEGNYFKIESEGVTEVESVLVTYGCIADAVEPLQSIKIDKAPKYVEYYSGEQFAPDEMVVKAVYKDGSEQVITDYSYSKSELSSSDTSVEISWRGKTATQGIKVIDNDLTISGAGMYYVEGENLMQRDMVIQSGREGLQIEGHDSAHGGKAIGSINAESKFNIRFELDKKYDVNLGALMAKYESGYNLKTSMAISVDGQEITDYDSPVFGHDSGHDFDSWREVNFGKLVLDEGVHNISLYFKSVGPNIDCFTFNAADHVDLEEKTIATPDNTNSKLFKVNGNYVEIDRSATSMFAAYTKRVIFYIYNSLTADKEADSLGCLILKKEDNKFYLADSENSKNLELQGEPGNLYFEKNHSQSLETFENMILKVVGNQISTLENIYFAAKVISDKEYVEENKYVYKDSDISDIAPINHGFTIDTVKIDAPPTNSNPFYYNSGNGYLEIDRNVGSKSMFNAYTNYVRVDLYNSSSATIGDDSLGYFIMESTTGAPMLNQMNSGVLLTSDRTMSAPIHGGSGNVFTNSPFGGTLQAFVNHEVGVSTDLGTIYISVKVFGGNYVRVSESKFAIGLDSDFSSLYKLYQ